MIEYGLLRAEASQHPYPLLFATISGAHLYGFPSPDSDFDLRGAHIIPVEEAVGLLPKREMVENSAIREGKEYAREDLIDLLVRLRLRTP